MKKNPTKPLHTYDTHNAQNIETLWKLHLRHLGFKNFDLFKKIQDCRNTYMTSCVKNVNIAYGMVKSVHPQEEMKTKHRRKIFVILMGPK